jgi:methylmalonyl-CoA mutase
VRDLRQLQQPAHERLRRGGDDADRGERAPRDGDPAHHQPNENPNQGSFIIDELTDLVEEAVLKEFDAIASRGGVLGAMETGYQRGKIQDESLFYEHQKHDGSLPIIGVNTFRDPNAGAVQETIELARSSEKEKQSQRSVVIENGNTFGVLMEAVRCCSLGQITRTLYDVGGKYRRNM